MKIYLAGPIRGLTYEGATDWREYAERELANMGHISASPMRGKDYLKGKGPLNGDGSTDGSYPAFPMSTGHGLFRRDVFDVAMCDAILANFEAESPVSIGTCMEIQRGFDLGKYVLTVCPQGSIHDHAFIHQASSLVVPTLDDALNYLYVVGQPYVSFVV